MALKDCKFFVDIDGRQVEMDFDGFRAHLMQDGMMATLAPAVTKKRGKSAGFTITARKAEAPSTRAEAPPARAEAPPAGAEAPLATPAKQGKKKAAEKGYFKVTNGALRQIFNISKDQATGVIQIAKAMGIDLDEIRLARGEAVPPGEQGLEQKAVALTMDAEYLAAVKAKDLAKAQEMVIAAAQAAGYNETGSHGLAEGKLEGSKFDTARLGKHTRAASAKLGFFFGSKETAKAYAYKELNFDKAEEVSSMATAILTPLLDVIPKGKSSELDFARNNIETMFSPRVYPVVLPDNYVSDIYSEVARLMDEALFVADSDELTPSEEQILRNALRKAQELLNDTLGNVPFYSVIDAAQIDAVLQMSNPFVYDQEGKRYREQAYFDIIRQAKEQGHDSVIIKNTYDGGPLDDIKVVFNANQIKSADPVTYDDKGNVISLSERFQSATPDIRYQKTVKTSDKKLAQTGYHATRGLFAAESGFPNGRLRLDKVGSGMGGQAYGWGIYLAPERAGAASYYDALKAESPTAVLYELDVPDDVVAKLLDFDKPIPLKQRTAINRELKALGVDLEIDGVVSLGEVIEQIQDTAFPDNDDYAKLTSKLLDRAGIPGLQVSAFAEQRPYVLWNQEALDRVALLKANGEALRKISETSSSVTSTATTETEDGAGYWDVQPEEATQGLITFLDREDKRMTNGVLAVIRGFAAANVSTPIHEMFHFYRRFLLNEENGFTAAEIKAFEDWAGAKDGVWSTAADEKAARGFEKYLRTGVAPLESLNALFKRVAEWMRSVYKTLQNSPIDIDISSEARRVYDRIFTLAAERRAKPDTKVSKVKRGSKTLYQTQVSPEEGPIYLDNILEALKTWAPKGTPEQLKSHLSKFRGAIAEANWIGLPVFLEGRQRVSRADVEQYVKDNEITIEEVLLGEPLGARTHHARFAQYTLPYGREYRELLLTIKPQDPRLISTQAGTHVFLPGKQERTKAMDPVQAERELARLMRVPTPNFVKRAHYLTPNIVVHVRFNERTLSNGKKALFLEEIQSDWAQAQRQGQSGRAVTPFEDTPVWTALAFRRMLRWATDKGFDEIAWTGGMTQARRWSQIVNTQREPRTDIESIAFKLAGTQNEIRVRPYGMQELDMVVYPVDGKPETYKSITLETLESEFGRDVKRKIESQIAADLQSAQAGTFSQALVKEVSFSDAERRQPSVHYTNQPQLSQIARAMLTYYDTIIPKEVQKLIKPFGGKVTSARLESGQTVHAVSITDKMKAQARQGQVLFQREGEGATEETATEAYRKRLAAQRAKDVQAAFARLRQQTSTAEPRTAKTQTKTPESKKTTAASSSQPRQPRERREPGTEPKRGFDDKTLDQVFNELVEAVKAGTLPRQTAPATDTERLEERLRRNLRDIVVAAYSLKAIPESVAAQGRDFAAAMLKAQAAGDTATFEAAEQEFRKIAAAARRAMRPQPPPKPAKSVAEKFDDLLKGRVKSKPAAEFNLEQMADDNIARLARRFQAKLKIAIMQGADSEMYLENVTINGKTRSRRDLFVTGAEEYKQGLLENNPLLRQQGEDKMRAAIDTITSVLIDKKRPEWHNLRSPLSYANVIGSYEAIMGPLGKQISDEFKIVHSAIARGKTSFSDALRVLQSIIKEQYEPQMIAQGYLGMPGIIKEHIAFIQKTARFSAAVTEAKAQGTLFTNPAAWYAARRDLAQDFGYLPVAALILKSTVYNLKLRFNVKSAASNFSQLALSAGPYLTVDEFAKIVKDSLKPSTWRREVAPGMTLRDVAVGETGGRRVDGAPELSDKTRWWHRVDAFQISSDHVRVAAYLVGELMANRLEAQRSAEGKPLLSFGAKSMIIRDWVEKVEFDNSPWNRAPLFRGAKADILLQFKPFLQKNVERMMADLQRNPEGFIVRPARTAVGKLVDVTLPQNVRRVVKLLATQVTFGGIGSLLTVAPGLKAISGVLILAGLMNLFKNAFGMDDDEAEELAIGMYYGAPAAIGVDLSATVGFFDEPFGKDIYEQIVSYFLGPSVGSAANVVKRTREYFKASQEAPKLGREAEKAREVRERLLKIPAAVSPYIRMYQAAQDMVTGQPTIMRLQEEKPLSATQQIIQALGGNPIEQTMFFDTKEAFGWQNRLIGKPTGYERVKPKPGESDEAYFKRAAVAETLASQYLPALQRHPQFQQMSSSDQAALLDNLSRNITEEAGKTRPDRRKLQANTLIRNRKQTIREQRKRARREARTAGFIR